MCCQKRSSCTEPSFKQHKLCRRHLIISAIISSQADAIDTFNASGEESSKANRVNSKSGPLRHINILTKAESSGQD